MEGKKKFIDIEEVIRGKNPSLLKWMPAFLLKYIKKIAHEKDINHIMDTYGHWYGLDFVNALIQEFGVNVYLEGEENIPLEGSVIFAANHPLGGLDGIAFMYALGKYRSDLKFLVNDILSNIKNFDGLFIPVNKHGSHGREASRLIEETYASSNAVLVFPAGLVSRKHPKGMIKDLEWKKSFINKARKYKKNIIPVYIEGKNSMFFYNLARLRKQLGIKANIEMFYLADEMFAQRNKKITIHIGKPISYEYFDQSKTDNEWAQVVKHIVYTMTQDEKQ